MLQRVVQEHLHGCFVAATATLLECSYSEAFSRLFPGVPLPSSDDYSARISRLIEESLALLPQVGIQIKKANLRDVRSLKKRTALIILRWKYEPQLSHALVFDGEQGKFLDPSLEVPYSHRVYNNNLEAIYYVKRIQTNAEQQLPVRSPDPDGNQSPSGLPERSSLPGSQAPDGDAYRGCPYCAGENY